MAEITREYYLRRRVYAEWTAFRSIELVTIDIFFSERNVDWLAIAKQTEIVTLGAPMLLITKTGEEHYYITLNRAEKLFYECNYLTDDDDCLMNNLAIIYSAYMDV